MTKKNLYYAVTFRRINAFKVGILGIFLAICSWPRVFIEVFTRTGFGIRYFLFPLCLFLAACLAALPFIIYRGYPVPAIIAKNFTWYVYTVALVIFSFNRKKEIKRRKNSYDFAHFSESSGQIHPWFYTLGFLQRYSHPEARRIISVYIEPGIFLIAGIILVLLHQYIGVLFIVCSIIYSMSWSAQYYLGDQFVLNKIDEMICNEELVNSFVHNRPGDKTRGFEFYGTRPGNMEFRRKVADTMIEEEPPVDVI